MQRVTDPLAFVGRELLALIFVNEGAGGIAHYSDVADYMQAGGVSSRLLPLIILTEFGGGLMVSPALRHDAEDLEACEQLQIKLRLAFGLAPFARPRPDQDANLHLEVRRVLTRQLASLEGH